MKDQVCSIVPRVQNEDIDFNPQDFAMAKGDRTYLVYHVDKRLGVVLVKTANHLDAVLARKDGLDQGGAVGHGERAFDQTPNGWGVKI